LFVLENNAQEDITSILQVFCAFCIVNIFNLLIDVDTNCY